MFYIHWRLTSQFKIEFENTRKRVRREEKLVQAGNALSRKPVHATRQKKRMTSQRNQNPRHKRLWLPVALLACLSVAMPGKGSYAQVGDDQPIEATKVQDGTPASPDSSTITEQLSGADNSEIIDDGTGVEDATTTERAALTDKATEPDPWDAFFPPPDPVFDWIKIVSDEWLKGEIKSLYNYKFEFESDELDSIKFEWDDVLTIRSAGPQAVRYVDLKKSNTPLVAIGQLTLIGDIATIGTGPDATTIRRDQIISIATGTGKKRDLWSGEVTLGVNVRAGNSDLADGATFMMVQRRTAESRFYADYRSSFSKAEGIETSNNHLVNSYFDWFKTRRWYWRILFAEYFRDQFQNVQNQITVGTGAGYDIIRSARTEWDISAGIGVLYKEATSVEQGEDSANSSPALSIGTLYDIELTKSLDYYLKYTARFVDEENGRYIHTMVTTLSSDITGSLDLDLTLFWSRTQKPQPAADGSVPKKDDLRFTVGLSYEF